MRGRNFRKAVFDRSNLARVDFSATDLTEASLQGAKLEGAKFECATPAQFVINRDGGPDGAYDSTYTPRGDCAKLEQVNLSTANLDSASFHRARMKGANLGSTVVKNAAFSGAELLGARFNNANGSGANFFEARLTSADFRNAQLIAANFNRASLQGAHLSRAVLRAANFDNADMLATNLSEAILQAASFYRAYLHDATLDYAEIKGAFFSSSSLRGASLNCVKPYRTNLWTDDTDTKIKATTRADLSETIVNHPGVKCGYNAEYIGSSYADDLPSCVRDAYNIRADQTPGSAQQCVKFDGAYGSGYTSGWHDYGYTDIYPNSYSYDISPDDIFTHPEKLSPKDFEFQLNKFLSDLPDENKDYVRRAFERLKPGARTKEEDEDEKAFWTEWAKKSAKPESHDKALAARLEEITCVAEGAPYVARGLLRAGRFDRLHEDRETNEKEKNRILERLRKASGGGGDDCPGARGLVEEDFLKPAS